MLNLLILCDLGAEKTFMVFIVHRLTDSLS